jgi:GNAT superfamily N-acetyltransferase
MTGEPASDLIGASLRGPHRHLAVGGDGPALRYRPDVGSFASLGLDPDAAVWESLTALPGDRVALVSNASIAVPSAWTKAAELPVLLMGGRNVEASGDDPELVELRDADVPEMLELVARTAPGPFLDRTIECGGYVGIRRDGALIAMGGRRVHPPGWVEVSAVCTDPAYRGLGLARRVMAAVIAGIRADGEEPFLHVLPSNPARRLYESMGFVIMGETLITVVQRGPVRRA